MLDKYISTKKSNSAGLNSIKIKNFFPKCFEFTFNLKLFKSQISDIGAFL